MIGVLQEGHLDEGLTIDRFLGSRYMQTLRNDPITEPKTKTVMKKNIFIIIHKPGKEIIRSLILGRSDLRGTPDVPSGLNPLTDHFLSRYGIKDRGKNINHS